jgi:hypothetical protein
MLISPALHLPQDGCESLRHWAVMLILKHLRHGTSHHESGEVRLEIVILDWARIA